MENKVINYLKARKEKSRELIGEEETVKSHIKDIFNEKVYKLIADISGEIENHNDDYESLYYNGILYSWDDFYGIDVDKFSRAIKEHIEYSKENYDYTDDDIKDWYWLIEFLKDWKGYIFTIQEKHNAEYKENATNSHQNAEDSYLEGKNQVSDESPFGDTLKGSEAH